MGIIKWLKNKKVSKKIINEDDYIKSTLVHISYATSNPTMYIYFIPQPSRIYAKNARLIQHGKSINVIDHINKLNKKNQKIL